MLCLAAGRTVAEWNFSKASSNLGWQPNGDITAASVTNGLFSFATKGSDPILEYRPLLDIAASPRQAIEIKLKADHDGTAEVFWSNTLTGKYGGFTQEKTLRFAVRGDAQWRTYRLLPFWQNEGKVVRLRFDLYDAARFDLAFFRIVDLHPGSTATPGLLASFPEDSAHWLWQDPVSETESLEPLKGNVVPGSPGFLLSPPLKLPTAGLSFLTIRMAVSKGERGTVFYASDRHSGLHSRSFPIIADGQEHTYNLDMLDAPNWEGNILAVALQPSREPDATATVYGIQASEFPCGPPELRVVSIGMEPTLPRSGRPAWVRATILNTGGQIASNLTLQIQLPEGVQLDPSSAPRRQLQSLEFDQKETVSWQVLAPRPVEGFLRINVKADNARKMEATGKISLTPAPPVTNADYVPVPKPVRGEFEVGAYYFPGWRSASQWQPLEDFPERRPVLGRYSEGSPEVVDWHIKWAVEHGITFFAYDWYWSKGSRHLEHALHDGFFKAKYRRLLKFCLLWANHNPPGSSSHNDCLAVTRFWIENYFQRPEYFKIDGKPLMIIFAPGRLTDDLGIEGTRRAIAAMRAECQRAGLPGIHLAACIHDAGSARRALEEGYDSVTAYNWPGLGLAGGALQGPFSSLIEGYHRHWQALREVCGSRLNPLPLNGGWDSRPWHGENNLVRFDRTPALFKEHVRQGREFLQHETYKSAPKVLLVEAWNEWGEGSYIEPHAEFGFGYLDALREVLTTAPTAHTDLTPQDAGLGPYEVTPASPTATGWDFLHPGDAWLNTMQISETKVKEGVLSGVSDGPDPAFFGPPIRARAADFPALRVRLRLTGSNSVAVVESGQLFWQTTRQAESEATSVRFPVTIDGNWHDYSIPVAGNPRWRGTITRLRLDPANRPNVRIELDEIRLVPR